MTTETTTHIDIPGLRKEIREFLKTNPTNSEVNEFMNERENILMLGLLQLIANGLLEFDSE